jgi:hypothetical protein
MRIKGPALCALVVTAGVAAISTALAASAVIAVGPPCHAKNVRTEVKYRDDAAVASAIADAVSGDTISIWGTCHGNFTVDKDLTLRGRDKNATLDGDQEGRVLTIADGTTTIEGLTITNGRTSGLGGGIYVGTAAVLRDVVVTGNAAGATQFGGGIEADFGSSLTLVDSTVSENSAGGSGGIDMFRAKATLINSQVTRNHATRTPGTDPDGCLFDDVLYACAGGIWNYQGTLVLVDSKVSGNTSAFRGGGVTSYLRLVQANPVSGYTILSGTSSITSNSATDQGGGVWANDVRSLVAADGSATYSDPISGETLPAWSGSVSGNAPDQCFPVVTLAGTTCGT